MRKKKVPYKPAYATTKRQRGIPPTGKIGETRKKVPITKKKGYPPDLGGPNNVVKRAQKGGPFRTAFGSTQPWGQRVLLWNKVWVS